MEVAFQYEILTFGQQVLKKHWPGVQLQKDITKVTGQDIPTIALVASIADSKG